MGESRIPDSFTLNLPGSVGPRVENWETCWKVLPLVLVETALIILTELAKALLDIINFAVAESMLGRELHNPRPLYQRYRGRWTDDP